MNGHSALITLVVGFSLLLITHPIWSGGLEVLFRHIPLLILAWVFGKGTYFKPRMKFHQRIIRFILGLLLIMFIILLCTLLVVKVMR